MNSQKSEKTDHQDTLDVVKIWDTIQGEGPYAGTPATFIRMAGCNLECEWCDTDYTTDRKRMRYWKVMQLVESLPKRKLVVITGGEPLRQNLSNFLHLLYKSERTIQIETNGTLLDSDPLFQVMLDQATVVCSPKTPKVHDGIWSHCDHLKYVVRAGEIDDDGLPLSSVGTQYGRPGRPPSNWRGTIYVQPMDEFDSDINALNLQAAVSACLVHGHRLSVQVHKMAGVE